MKKGKLLLFLLTFFLVITQILVAQTYGVRINCNVKGASLYVDGKYAGKLPGEFNLGYGTHTLYLKSPGYKDLEKTINVTSKLSMTINMEQGASVTFIPIPTVLEHKVTFSSNVNNADIFINGVLRAKTPATLLLQAGSYSVKVMANGYNEASQQIHVTGDSSFNLYLQPLVVYYPLEVTANLGSARVFINGKDSGETPFTLSLPEGNYAVRVVKQDYSDYEQAVMLNKATRIMAILQPLLAVVKISIPKNILNTNMHDPFQKIDVYLDGRKINGFTFSVTRGQHQIRIISGGLAMETNLDFAGGRSYEIKPNFVMEVK